MSNSRVFALLLSSVIATSAAAQPTRLDSMRRAFDHAAGAPVKVSAFGARVTGKIIRRTADSVELKSFRPAAFSIASIDTVWNYDGRQTDAGFKGGLIVGGIAGTLTCTVAFMAYAGTLDLKPLLFSAGLCGTGGMMLGGLIGGVLGTLTPKYHVSYPAPTSSKR